MSDQEKTLSEHEADEIALFIKCQEQAAIHLANLREMGSCNITNSIRKSKLILKQAAPEWGAEIN